MLSEDYIKSINGQGPAWALSPNIVPVPPAQPEKFYGWKVTAVPDEGTELKDAVLDPFFQQFARPVCDQLAIAQLQGMNSVTIDGHRFAITVLELPLKEGENIPLNPAEAAAFIRPIVHALVDGHFDGTIRLVEEPMPPAPSGPKPYGFAGWDIPEQEL